MCWGHSGRGPWERAVPFCSEGHRRPPKPAQEARSHKQMLGPLTSISDWEGGSQDNTGGKWEAPHGPQDRADATGSRRTSTLATHSGTCTPHTTDLRTVALAPPESPQECTWRHFSLPTTSILFIKTGNKLWKNISSTRVGPLTKTDVFNVSCLTRARRGPQALW